MKIQQTYERLTLPRVRVFAALVEGRTIRDLARDLGYTYVSEAATRIREQE